MPEQMVDCVNALLLDRKAIAIVSRQSLQPVDGPGGVIFPPTYLGDNDKPTYNISSFGDGHNMCTIDSIPSQANRVEAAFLSEPYRSLTRSVVIKAELADGEEKLIDVLLAPHRLADATLRFSDLRDDVEKAFRAFRTAPEEVAKLSPMSLLLGAWDSRGTQVKIPRAFASRIEAHDVRPLQRHALYSAVLTSKELGYEAEKLSSVGLDNVLSGPSPAGVVAEGGIHHQAVLNLVALRQNCTTDLSAATPDALSEYILGLGLVALTLQPEVFLRQGCLLVEEGPAESVVRYIDGSQSTFELGRDDAFAYASSAAERFGVAQLAPRTAVFQPEIVEEGLKKAKSKRGAAESRGA